jgi:hypothetical protein
MTKTLLIYGKHPFGEILAYEMGEYLKRYGNENFKVRKCYTSIPWKIEFLDFTGLPEVYLSRLIERPDLIIDLHQGVHNFYEGCTADYERMGSRGLRQIPPTMNQIGFGLATPESIMKEFLTKKKGEKVPYIRSMIEAVFFKLFDLIGPKYMAIEVMVPFHYKPTQTEIEELSKRLYGALIQLPKDKRRLNQLVLEFNEKEDNRTWFEAYGEGKKH